MLNNFFSGTLIQSLSIINLIYKSTIINNNTCYLNNRHLNNTCVDCFNILLFSNMIKHR